MTVVVHIVFADASRVKYTYAFTVYYDCVVGMPGSQPKATSVGSGFLLTSPSDSDADLSHDQNY